MKKIIFLLFNLIFLSAFGQQVQKNNSVANLDKPLSVYITWASHDELSDTIPLSEELAMRQLDEMIRLKSQGVKFDYFLMDMFWFDKKEGYRKFKKEGWPNGPDAWLKKCKENDILPGLWLSTNVLGWGSFRWMEPLEGWEQSMAWNNSAAVMFYGEYLSGIIETMQMWYDQGIRLFKFDFADFNASPDWINGVMTQHEIVEMNEKVWYNALKLFRAKNPEIKIVAYNGYGGQQSNTSINFRKTINLKWLEVFDAMYCGDPRPADVPMMNFWRAKDIYSDHMVYQYFFNGVPYRRIDNSGFMVGKTGTCYYRYDKAWKGMLLLSLSRGGFFNTYYGNLDLITNDKAEWFARAQGMFYEILNEGKTEMIGNIPGSGKIYAFHNYTSQGGVFSVVNPSQLADNIQLPNGNDFRIIFSDSGFIPQLKGNTITVGPEQLVLVGYGKYSANDYILGVQDDVVIPENAEIIPFKIISSTPNQMRLEVSPSGTKNLRVLVKLTSKDGEPFRVNPGKRDERKSMVELIGIQVLDKNSPLKYNIQYNKKIWSGLSWGVVEVPANQIKGNSKKLTIVLTYPVNDNLEVTPSVFEVSY